MDPKDLQTLVPSDQFPEENRLQREREFHNLQAQGRLCTLKNPSDYLQEDSRFFNHAPWIPLGFHLLGDLAGLKILDLGSGNGMASVALARKGAQVVSFDISTGYLEETRTRCLANGVKGNWVSGCGEKLPFASETFDRVWGNAILHHLELNPALSEIKRVLKKAGKAVFCEPAALSKPIYLVRRCLGKSGKHTPDEAPLTWDDLRRIKQAFPISQWRGVQVLGALPGVSRWGWSKKVADWLDRQGVRWLPFYQYLCRYVIVSLEN
ncbi:MAG: class I SAM-dependent methyltransferase [Gemmataceae bacterium]|nr:class I SAM-dependent methyltransferase [Gemmataceae bacterium]